jgi:hypothetical protein
MKKRLDDFSSPDETGNADLPEVNKVPIDNSSSGLQEGIKGVLEHPEDFEQMNKSAAATKDWEGDYLSASASVLLDLWGINRCQRGSPAPIRTAALLGGCL